MSGVGVISGRQKKAAVLLVDSVHSYRQYLINTFRDIGISNTVGVGSADEAIQCASEQFFDVIISEYDLGNGKNGIQFLEALKEKKILQPETVFIFLAAEMSKSVVVSAYDLEPDAYLAKPISAKDLLQRVIKLLTLKDKLKDVYKVAGFLQFKNSYYKREKDNDIDEQGLSQVIDFLNATLLTVDNPANKLRNTCLKILGRAYLTLGDTQSAEETYRQVLEVMPLDWAKVGMARIKKENNNEEAAIQDFENIINAHPLCLEAYDELINIHYLKHNKESHKNILSRAAQLSPLSILRQEQLGVSSFGLSDYRMSSAAFQSTIKLGRFSVYDKFSNYADFGRSANLYLQKNPDGDRSLLQDAIKAMAVASDRFDMSKEEMAQLYMVQSQSFFVQGNDSLSKENALLASQYLSDMDVIQKIETEIDIISMKTMKIDSDGFPEQGSIDDITARFKCDESALEKIDKLLNEPISQANREYIGKINKEGIDFYDRKKFQESIECFERAIKAFPKYVPLHLNLVQALHGYCVNGDRQKNEDVGDTGIDSVEANSVVHMKQSFDRASAILAFIKTEINNEHPEYKRYSQLQDMIADIAPSFKEH
ncbi:MAG: response regulator [Cellvibrionaceae bacterium]